MELDLSRLDWPTIIVAGVISIPAGVLGIVLYNRMIAAWGTYRGFRSEQRRNEALRRMKVIHSLKTGEEDKVFYVGLLVILKVTLTTVILIALAGIILSTAEVGLKILGC